MFEPKLDTNKQRKPPFLKQWDALQKVHDFVDRRRLLQWNCLFCLLVWLFVFVWSVGFACLVGCLFGLRMVACLVCLVCLVWFVSFVSAFLTLFLSLFLRFSVLSDFMFLLPLSFPSFFLCFLYVCSLFLLSLSFFLSFLLSFPFLSFPFLFCSVQFFPSFIHCFLPSLFLSFFLSFFRSSFLHFFPSCLSFFVLVFP